MSGNQRKHTAQALSVRNERSSGMTAPRLKLVKDGDNTNIVVDPFELRLLKRSLGTEDADFAQELFLQVAYAHPRRDEAGINFLLSVIKGVKPKDQLEAMLAAQMAVTHGSTMTFARRLNHVQDIQQQDSGGGDR
jgi:hypothetical protein